MKLLTGRDFSYCPTRDPLPWDFFEDRMEGVMNPTPMSRATPSTKPQIPNTVGVT